MMRTLPTVLAPGGFFAYRDVYAVGRSSLHDRVIQSYNSRAWLTFLRLFTPQYLAEGTHPYHHADDELGGPPGLADRASGRAGPRDLCGGSGAGRAVLAAMSEPYADHHTIDSDIFDSVTDVALLAFLEAAESGDIACRQVWGSWLLREGRETYAYMTADQLLTAFAVHSAEATTNTVLMPVQAADILRVDRHYCNRFLTKRLSNPLPDTKQLVLFQNVPRGDAAALRQAFDAVQGRCGKPSLARMYTAINKGDNWTS